VDPGVSQVVRQVGLVAAVATLAAGLVGVLRQREEVARVLRGELERATAAADLPPAAPPGPIGERLAVWVPPRPASGLGRTAAAIWAAPMSAVGLALAAAAGRRPRWDATHGCLVVDAIRGPSALALRTVGADANTIGQVVLSRHLRTPEVLLAHEAVHVRQTERLGPFLLPAYVWLAARYGYRDHPLERAAREGARRELADR
jgi:hypothetical protein